MEPSDGYVRQQTRQAETIPLASFLHLHRCHGRPEYRHLDDGRGAMKLLFKHSEFIELGTEPEALFRAGDLLDQATKRLADPKRMVRRHIEITKIGDRAILVVRLYDKYAIDWNWALFRGVLLAVLISILYHYT
jgi:hypothetical protein